MDFSGALFHHVLAGPAGFQSAVSTATPGIFSDPNLLFGFDGIVRAVSSYNDSVSSAHQLRRLVEWGDPQVALNHLKHMACFVVGMDTEKFSKVQEAAQKAKEAADRMVASGLIYKPWPVAIDGFVEGREKTAIHLTVNRAKDQDVWVDNLASLAFNTETSAPDLQSYALLGLIDVATVNPSAVYALQTNGLEAYGPEHIRALAKAAVIEPALKELLEDLRDKHLDAGAVYRGNEKSAEQTHALGLIELYVTDCPEGKTPVVVVDLDDSLFSMRARETAIWRAYGREAGIPPLAFFLPEDVSGGDIKSDLLRLDFDSAWVEHHFAAIKSFWTSHFFSPYFAPNITSQYDTPMPGAADYFCKLHQLGAHLVYVTRSDGVTAREITVAALKKHGFPIDTERTELLMNLKKEEVYERVKTLGPIAGSFDNETSRANDNWKNLHDEGEVGLAVRVNTTQSIGSENIPLQAGVATIQGFLR